MGPRILFSGHALSQTGGHGDMRERGDEALVSCGCCHGTNVTLGRVCDGVAEVRKASRRLLVSSNRNTLSGLTFDRYLDFGILHSSWSSDWHCKFVLMLNRGDICPSKVCMVVP